MKLKIRQPKQLEQNQTSESSKAPGSKSFSDHIGELRRRSFLVALAFIIASSLAYNYRDLLVDLIMKPLGDEKLIYLTPGGGFNFIFQVTLYAGLLAAAPMLIYQLYGFIRPALPSRAQRSAGKVVAAAFILMMCGVAFGYFVAVPSALNFLSTFAGTDVAPSLTADSYLGFFLAYIAGLGVLFQLPLLLLFFHWIHPMTPGKLLKSEKFVILFAFVASAMITPTPDVLNQSMIAIPLIAIYQLGVVVVLISVYKDHKKHKKHPIAAAQKQESTAPSVVALASPSPISSVSKPAQALPAATTQQSQILPSRRIVRGIDGFKASSRPPVSSRSITPQRPIQPLPRQPRQALVPYKRPLSIDGFMMG